MGVAPKFLSSCSLRVPHDDFSPGGGLFKQSDLSLDELKVSLDSFNGSTPDTGDENRLRTSSSNGTSRMEDGNFLTVSLLMKQNFKQQTKGHS